MIFFYIWQNGSFFKLIFYVHHSMPGFYSRMTECCWETNLQVHLFCLCIHVNMCVCVCFSSCFLFEGWKEVPCYDMHRHTHIVHVFSSPLPQQTPPPPPPKPTSPCLELSYYLSFKTLMLLMHINMLWTAVLVLWCAELWLQKMGVTTQKWGACTCSCTVDVERDWVWPGTTLIPGLFGSYISVC